MISAPSGGGKTTLIQALLQKNSQIQSVVTHTTRPMREGEINDTHYHFVSVHQFEGMIHNHELIEWAHVYDQYYGTSKAAIDKVLKENKTPILNIDWQGAQNVRKLYSERALMIFILPPNLSELETRLKARGDSNESIARRLASAEEEITHAEEYDHVIVNDHFEQALQELEQLIIFCN